MGEPALDTTEDLQVAKDPEKTDDLRSFVQRIERLEDEKATIADDIKAVKAQAKAEGWDVKTISKIVKLRRTDERTLQEEELLLKTYKEALGM